MDDKTTLSFCLFHWLACFFVMFFTCQVSSLLSSFLVESFSFCHLSVMAVSLVFILSLFVIFFFLSPYHFSGMTSHNQLNMYWSSVLTRRDAVIPPFSDLALMSDPWQVMASRTTAVGVLPGTEEGGEEFEQEEGAVGEAVDAWRADVRRGLLFWRGEGCCCKVVEEGGGWWWECKFPCCCMWWCCREVPLDAVVLLEGHKFLREEGDDDEDEWEGERPLPLPFEDIWRELLLLCRLLEDVPELLLLPLGVPVEDDEEEDEIRDAR